jgi:type IV pilus assembly protein PilP
MHRRDVQVYREQADKEEKEVKEEKITLFKKQKRSAMNTLRGIISLTMLSFLVTATGTWDNQALALAKPAVVRKKILIPPASRDKKPSAVVPTLSPKADIAKTETVQNERPAPAAMTTGTGPRVKSDLASAPSGKNSSLVMAEKPPAAKVLPTDLPEPRQVEAVSTAVATAAAPPIPNAVADSAGPSLSQGTSSAEAAEPAAIVATVTVTEDRPPSIVDRTKDGDPLPYNPLGKIDPFEPLFKDEPELAPSESKREKRIPRTPLENIDLGQLKLVGVILASSGNRALVQEASGKGYIIKEGTYIGVNSGKVTEIKNDRVIVEEEIEDVVGKPTIRNKELVLPKPPGE